MKKSILLLTFAAMAALGATAQTNLQMMYDFGDGRQYVTTTFEMFKGDKWGDTFFFIDHYYATSDQRDLGVGSAINGSYFEIERGLNFWQESDLKDLSIHLEYDGATWGAGIASIGAKYFFHNDDFSNTYSVYAMWDKHIGGPQADCPIKFSGVWGMQDIFGISGCRFNGFIDFWGNDCGYMSGNTTHWSLLTEPQLWFNMSSIGIENLNIGGEVELSYNFAGNEGFMCNPCLGIKWAF